MTAVKKEKKAKVERFMHINGTVGEFMANGWEEIVALGEEFREICDNTSENLQQTDLYGRRDETASAVESLSEPSCSSSVLEELDAVTTIDLGKTYRGRQTQSRACRANNASAQIRAAADAVREWLNENEELPEADTNDPASMKARIEKLEELEAASIDPDDYEQARNEAESLADELESLADEIDGMDWPGMFG
jgi:DNA repair exonuclease SbcCD ATPase subunit